MSEYGTPCAARPRTAQFFELNLPWQGEVLSAYTGAEG